MKVKNEEGGMGDGGRKREKSKREKTNTRGSAVESVEFRERLDFGSETAETSV